ncbi:MAG TPA: hypothetical protein VHL53_00145 [Acidimicrobiia bacterium]|nr:hypothetical protein [Acidimicrobiia bacterium]
MAALPAAAWAAKPSAPVGGTADCGWQVTRQYGPETLTYRLHLALAGCSWWDGSARSLKVSVTRVESKTRQTAQSGPAPCAGPSGSAPASCDASATIQHPEGETARYIGEASWEWNDGRHRVTFDTTCFTNSETVSCADDSPDGAA